MGVRGVVLPLLSDTRKSARWIVVCGVLARMAAHSYVAHMESLLEFESGSPKHGWITFRIPEEPGVTVAVRCDEDANGHFRIRGLLIGGDPVNAKTLRLLSIARMEAFVNSRTVAAFVPSILRAAPTGDDFLQSWPGVGKKGKTRRQRVVTNPSLRLDRPDGQDPDSFYAEVARVYEYAITRTKSPAVYIADASQVPVATVRRWIAEARRREHLPAGHKGKAQ